MSSTKDSIVTKYIEPLMRRKKQFDNLNITDDSLVELRLDSLFRRLEMERVSLTSLLQDPSRFSNEVLHNIRAEILDLYSQKPKPHWLLHPHDGLRLTFELIVKEELK